MADIDFLSQSNKKTPRKKNGEENTSEDFEWTDPEAEKAAIDAGQPIPPAAVRLDSEKTRTGMNKKYSGSEPTDRSRRGAENDKQLSSSGQPGRGTGLFGFIRKVNRLMKKPSASGLGLKEKKEMMAESEEIIHNDKILRKRGPALSNQTSADRGGRRTMDKSADKYVDEEEQWKAPKVLKTNLIQDEITAFFDWKRNIKSVIAIFFLCAAVIGAGYAGLSLWEIQAMQKSESLTMDIESVKQKIIKLEGEVNEINAFQKKLTLASTLLKDHIYWTNFFKFIEENTLADVNYNGGFSGNTSGEYSFAATAPGYNTITDQLTVLNNIDLVTEVNVDTGSLGVSTAEGAAGGYTVSFQLQLSVDPKIFKK